MKLSAQEEYGLRCLLHLARQGVGKSTTIPEISKAEGLSIPNVAKLMRVLRLGGLVQSARGQAGGYTLAVDPSQVSVASVLEVLGGKFFTSTFCERHAGRQTACTHVEQCSLRPLWVVIQTVLNEILTRTSLQDLLDSEEEVHRKVRQLTASVLPVIAGTTSHATVAEQQ